MRSALALGAVLLAVAACGTNEEPATGGDASAAEGTSLDITVVLAEGGTPVVYSLTCDPAGGDHPNPDAACAKLADAGAKIFDPVPADQACTMIFGGPQTATITGTYDGAAVDAAFARSNGCEIDRWDALGTEVFDVPLQ